MSNSDQFDDKCPCCGRPYDVPEKKSRRNLKAIREAFEVFWKAYPRKTAKGAARAAWEKNNLPPIEEILAALRKAIASADWQKEQGKFIPHPSTWINQARWEDQGMDYAALSQKTQRTVFNTPVSDTDAQAFKQWMIEQGYPQQFLDTPFNECPDHVKKEYNKRNK
jgi:hypothetical protein